MLKEKDELTDAAGEPFFGRSLREEGSPVAGGLSLGVEEEAAKAAN